MNVLLTGHTGFLGKYIYDYFRSITNVNLYTLGRSLDSDYVEDLKVKVDEFNLKFDIVVHTAGKAHFIPKNSRDAKVFFNVNHKGTLNLLRALSKYPPVTFVFISSVSVYGVDEGTNIKENTPLIAEDSYGKSKILAEQSVIEWATKQNVKYLILRLPLLVGKNPPGNLGLMIDGIQKGYYFNISGGKAKKSMVLASDVAKILLKAAEVGGIYNLTDGYHPTFYELSKHIASQLGKSAVPNMPSWMAKEVAKIGNIIGDRFPIDSNKLAKITSPLTFDDSKARVVFGWKPTPVLEGFKLKSHDE